MRQDETCDVWHWHSHFEVSETCPCETTDTRNVVLETSSIRIGRQFPVAYGFSFSIPHCRSVLAVQWSFAKAKFAFTIWIVPVFLSSLLMSNAFCLRRKFQDLTKSDGCSKGPTAAGKFPKIPKTKPLMKKMQSRTHRAYELGDVCQNEVFGFHMSKSVGTYQGISYTHEMCAAKVLHCLAQNQMQAGLQSKAFTSRPYNWGHLMNIEQKSNGGHGSHSCRCQE